VSVKTNELQQVSSTSAEDFLLVDSPTGGTVRVPLSVAAGYFDEALLRPGTALSAALNSKAIWEMLPNQDLLDNGDFRHVVNQRGADRYASSGKMIYTIDRWALGGDTDMPEWSMRIIENHGITLAKGSALIQYFEESRWPVGSQLTFSAMIDGKVYSVSFIADATSDYAGVTFENGFRLAWNGSGRYVQIYNHAGTGAELVIAAKLEPGIHQTLAHQEADGTWLLNNPPTNKALELTKCQRYQMVIPYARIRASARNNNGLQFDLPIPTTLRAKPILVNAVEGSTYRITDGLVYSNYADGFSLSVTTMPSGLVSISAHKENHGLSDACILIQGVILDANL